MVEAFKFVQDEIVFDQLFNAFSAESFDLFLQDFRLPAIALAQKILFVLRYAVHILQGDHLVVDDDGDAIKDDRVLRLREGPERGASEDQGQNQKSHAVEIVKKDVSWVKESADSR
jgi:hypothetical protein